FLLHQEDIRVSPVLMLLVYCWVVTACAWCSRYLIPREATPFSVWRTLTKAQKLTFIKLGLATFGVYASTFFGISLVGAPIFNMLDYGAMPLMTILSASLVVKEKVSRARVFCGVLALLGVACLFWADIENVSKVVWTVGLLLALSSPLLTAYSSALQKAQVDSKLHPDEVLLYRF